MGGSSSVNSNKFSPIPDRYKTSKDLSDGLRKAGLEGTNLIVGIDFTESNKRNGIDNSNLHEGKDNPYYNAIKIIGEILEPFDEDHLIPTYGFGDIHCKNKYIFNVKPDGSACDTFKEVLEYYNKLVPLVQLSGPTSFVPLIEKAIDIVKESGTYHILLILTDGEVVDIKQTADAIIKASRYPLSIIVVGLGVADFKTMEEFDDNLPQRKFDNYQFVNYLQTERKAEKNKVPLNIMLGIDVLQELPEQYMFLKKNNMLCNSQSIESKSNCEIKNPYMLFSKRKSETKEKECPICNTSTNKNVVSNCGHVICESCSTTLKSDLCVICRTKVTQYIRVY